MLQSTPTNSKLKPMDLVFWISVAGILISFAMALVTVYQDHKQAEIPVGIPLPAEAPHQ
jgi:hypothetical protein